MKTKIYTLIQLLALSGILVMNPSCRKTTPAEAVQATSIKDMHVPYGFLFKTTRDVTISIRTLDNMDNVVPNIRVSVMTDFPDQGGKCIVSGVTDATGYYNLDYVFPVYLDSVVVATNELGFVNAQKFDVRNGSLTCLLGGKQPVVNLKDGGTFKSTVNNFYPMGTYNSVGVPSYLTPANDPVDAAMLQDINATLPDYQNLTVGHPQYFSAGNVQNLVLNAPSDVWVTFVSEGAGYRSVLGYYKYTSGSPPPNTSSIDSIHVIFPNVSFTNSGGGLASGNRVHLGVFPGGVTLGWALISDGFRGGTITAGNYTYYSNKELNPEPVADKRQHTILLNDIGRGKFLLSFEDLRRDQGADNDFNDATFYVTANPMQAVQTTNLPLPNYTQVDTDHDGISNTFDDYPTDASRAFNNYYPAQGSTGTLAFEDLWPSTGDYDMNDMVVGYSFNQVTNGQNKVIQINATLILKAMGAGYHNGFGIQLPVSPSLISSVTGTNLQGSYISLNSNGTEAGQSKATVIAFDDGFNLLPYPGNGTGVNTTPGMTYVPPDTLHLVINLTTPTLLSQVGVPPYNPFLIVDMDRGREIHMINKLPTDLANMAYFGTGSDNSQASIGRYYVTQGNLPWAIDVSDNYEYPVEKSEITQLYLKFVPWVEASGQTYYDWFEPKAGYRNPQFLYMP